jgi:membrane protease YdiL (CAAX protease family)
MTDLLAPQQRRVLFAVLVTGVFLVAMRLADLLAIQLGWYGPPDAPLALARRIEVGMVAIGFAAAVVFALAWVVPPDVGFTPRRSRLALGAYAAFLGPWFLVGVAAYTAVLLALDRPLTIQAALHYWRTEPFHAWGPWVVAFGTCLAGPLAEELVFRGYVQGALRPFLGANGAIAGSALVFGYAHGLQYLLPIGLLGLLFGWLRERAGSLWAPFVAHAVHNGLTLVTALAWPELIDWIYRR